MRVAVVIVACAALLLSCVAAEAVVTLTEDNFHKTINGNEFVLVEFYAPWCGHCKSLAAPYEAAAQQLLAEGIVLAKVDATVETALAEPYGVSGYPTLKFFKSGEVSDYTGGRTTAEIVGWLRKKTGPAAKALSSQAEIDAFVSANTNAVVGYFKGRTAAYKQFLATAESLNDFTFGEVFDASLAAAAGVEVPAVVYHRPESVGPKVTYVGGADLSFDKQELVRFLKQAGLPLVGVVGPETFSNYFEAGIPLFIAFIDLDNADQLSTFTKAMEPLAEAHRGKYNFGYCDGKMFAEQAKRFGASGNTPDMALLNFEKNINIGFDGAEFTTDAMATWVADAVAGKKKWVPKSQPVPESQETDVVVAVGSNIEDVIATPGKNVFVKYYAPWCGHCKAMAADWDKLAAHFAKDDTVLIVKIDADANDVQHVQAISGFPTLVFYDANTKTPENYRGNRDLESLKEFVLNTKQNPQKSEL